jgi:HD-GYP domain-containing protein (c-di-GMP phosphodiesterase class II)
MLETNQVIRNLLKKLDDHAAGERAHAERVSVYAVATGDALGVRGEDLLVLRYAAELHDIGKLSVDPALLLAERPLEPDERVTVERHVIEADKYLAGHKSLKETLPIIRSHHERWDGGGYPAGLAGIEIPFASRIIAAAETFDVMLAGAPWRAPFPEDAAIAAMQGLSGTWFEPSIVDALLRVQPIIQPPLDL